MPMRIEAAGERRTFRVTAGLTPGYAHSPLTLPLPADDAVNAIMDWQTDCRGDGLPHLNGVVRAGVVVYAGPNGHGREPVVVFEGEVSVRDQPNLGDSEVVAALNGLAERLAYKLAQQRVYVAYRDESWVLVRE